MILYTTALGWLWCLTLVTAAPSELEPVGPDAAAPGFETDGDSLTLALPDLELSGDGAVGGASGDVSIPADRLKWHIPDPELDRQTELLDRLARLLDRLDKLSSRLAELDAVPDEKKTADEKKEYNIAKGEATKAKIEAAEIQRVLELLDSIRRPVQQFHLTLQEAVRRTLEKNYAIQILRYNPAIDTTRVVEAEAAFDASFFSNIVKNKIDRPSGNQLTATNLDLFTSNYGVRKVLPTGMSVSGSYQLNRTKSATSFQTVNPEYDSNFVLEMRQPLLRNFGIDFNRSLILLAKNDRRISDHAFRAQVRDTLRQVEEYYWRLVQARRDVVITARLIAGFETIYEFVVARQAFDITPVQIAATEANLEQSRADFVRRRAAVFDAEDRLTAAMNSDDLNLADDIEIIPDDVPQLSRIVVDRLAEVQTALDHRPEIKQQELRVASAKIAEGRAKNGQLPRFDLTFRQTSDGLGVSADQSFDELTRSHFIEYFVGVEFEMPIGNRGPSAAHQRSRLQYFQAIASLKKVFEDVILDVNLTTRALSTSYDQIGPSFAAAKAREREVESTVARAERKDINTLNSELGARQSLASARRAMIGAMVDYNIAVIDLERAKGTLLEYNNVVIPLGDD
jgi:outer membrane protein TolC